MGHEQGGKVSEPIDRAAEAENLLDQAWETQDRVYRAELLDAAQVHATLALKDVTAALGLDQS